MSGKWGITGYVVLSVITWGLATDPPLGKLKYLMNLIYVRTQMYTVNNMVVQNAIDHAKNANQ